MQTTTPEVTVTTARIILIWSQFQHHSVLWRIFQKSLMFRKTLYKAASCPRNYFYNPSASPLNNGNRVLYSTQKNWTAWPLLLLAHFLFLSRDLVHFLILYSTIFQKISKIFVLKHIFSYFLSLLLIFPLFSTLSHFCYSISFFCNLWRIYSTLGANSHIFLTLALSRLVALITVCAKMRTQTYVGFSSTQAVF